MAPPWRCTASPTPSILPIRLTGHNRQSAEALDGAAHAEWSSAYREPVTQPFKAGTVPDKAEFLIKVPAADAKLFFNDKLVEQQGTERKLLTPTLASGLTYTYRVRATWLENGQEKSQEQKLQALPGQALNLTFGEVPAKP